MGTKIAAPVSVTREMAERDIVRAESSSDESYKVASQVMTSIPGQMLSTFVNTLMSRGVLESIRKAILRGFSSASESYNPKEKIYEIEKGAQNAMLALKTVDIAYTYKEINLIEEFALCPDTKAGGENIPSINNCVITDKFHDAVAASAGGKALTVQDAILQRALDPNLSLIGPGDARNLQKRCFEQGYCYGNLVKLRKARILPVGWEIAAKLAETQNKPVTLGEAIAGFYDIKSTWYHLIDPTWLLTAPLQRCRVEGYNDMLYAKGSDSRQEVCVDTQDCIRTDKNGKCIGGWGYCRAEENVWKLNGDQCPGQYDSCLNLTRSNGKSFNYLKNTLAESASLCNENNVGCKWYSLWKDGGNWADNKDYKLLANAKLAEKTCPSSAAGCSEFIQTTSGSGANLLLNGDFEAVDATNATKVLGWHPDGNSAKIEIAKDLVVSGEQSVKVTVPANNNAWDGLQTSDAEGDLIKIAPQPIPRFFAFSGYIYIPGTITGDWKLEPHYIKGNSNFAGKQHGGDFTWSGSTAKNQWIRKYIIIEIDPYVSGLRLAFTTNKGSGVIYVDAAMVEEIDPLSQGFKASDFKGYGENSALYLKKAPDYYKCYNAQDNNGAEVAAAYGTPYTRKNIKTNDDNALCDKFAKACAADEVGCEKFTNKATGEVVTGTPSYYDYCPNTCAGYDVFEQSASNFELGAFPFYMIPSNASVCSDNDVGCDEFTNLDVVAKGGEGREYYSELRMCRKPVPNIQQDSSCAAFYTWTGSDASGYQLAYYTLQDKDKNGEPDTTLNDSQLCNAMIYNANLAAQKISDCREFYNKDGKKTYHLYTKTITCSDDCHPYRRTLANEEDCGFSGGSWENGACVYMAVPKEGKMCAKANAGCREYKGSLAGNVEAVFKSTFEQGDAVGSEISAAVLQTQCGIYAPKEGKINWINGHCVNQIFDAKGTPKDTKDVTADVCASLGNAKWENNKCVQVTPNYTKWLGGVVSTESLYSGGHSLFLDTNVKSTETDVSGKVWAGVDYRLGWWAKRESVDAKTPMSVKIIVDGKELNKIDVDLQNDKEWHYYNIMQFNIPDGAKTVSLKLEKGFSGKLWLDDIKLYTVVDTHYLLKQSAIATVPSMCNQKLDGTVLPQAMLGCSEYRDRNGGTHFLKGFTKLCVPGAVGCEALMDTHNSDNPFVESFYQGAPLTGTNAKEVKQAELQDLCENSSVIFNKVKAEHPNISNLYWCVEKNSTLGRCESKPCDAQGGAWSYTSKMTCALSGNSWDTAANKCWKGSTLTVSADQMIYLVNDKNAQCTKDVAGCTAVGAPSLSSSGAAKEWKEAYYLVDPDDFKDTLCQYSGLGCDSFTTDEKGKTYYLFDPGERVCEYKTVEKEINGQTTNVAGWWTKYDKDADGNPLPCESKDYYNDGSQNLVRAADNSYDEWAGVCQEKYDKCTAFVDPSDKTLNEIGRPYYYLNDENLDKKACGNGASQYQGCILFNDTGNPNLTWASVATYADSKTQNGAKVSPKAATAKKFEAAELCPNYAACFSGANVNGQKDVPVDEIPDILYKAFYATNKLEMKQTANDCMKFESNFEKRQCFCINHIVANVEQCLFGQVMNQIQQDNQTPDSNMILSVNRNRQCKEWYSCAGGHWDWNATKQQYEKKCDVLGVCKKLVDGTEDCADLEVYDNNMDYDAFTVFSAGYYKSRNTDFSGIEYSGYTIPGVYPLHTLKSINVGSEGSKVYGLMFAGKSCSSISPCPADYKCSADKVCVKNPDGTKPAGVTLMTPISTRAYPEENSPFPASVLDLTGEAGEGNAADYSGAKICLSASDCGGRYRKITYGNKMREIYWNENVTSDKPNNICENDFNGKVITCERMVGGALCKQSTKMCDPTSDAQDFKYASTGVQAELGDYPVAVCGQCLAKDVDSTVYKGKDVDSTVYQGWDGYCLEKDSSNIVYGKKDQHPCYSWYPVDVISGTVDLNNYALEAGYVPPDETGNYYCTEPALFAYPSASKQSCSPATFESNIQQQQFGAICRQQRYLKMIDDLQTPNLLALNGNGKDFLPNDAGISLFDPAFEKYFWKLMAAETSGEEKIPDNFTGYSEHKCDPDRATQERTQCVVAYRKASAEKKCPKGYFPAFGNGGMSGFDPSDANLSDSLHYYCSGLTSGPDNDQKIYDSCGMVCVPYGSRLNITKQRIQDLEGKDYAEKVWPQLQKLVKYNGQECFPGLYYEGDAVKHLADLGVKGGNVPDASNWFSVLYIPYKYCEGPGYPVESAGFDYGATYDYEDTIKQLGSLNNNVAMDYGVGCYEASQVAKKDLIELLPQVKAWTNRITQQDKPLSYWASVGSKFAFYEKTNIEPFGSLDLAQGDLMPGGGEGVKSKIWDLIELSYCVTGNKLSLPTSFNKSGIANCASGQIYGNAEAGENKDIIFGGRGKSYGDFEALAPKSSYCTAPEECYSGEVPPVCDKKEIGAVACTDPNDVKAYWLWRDGCAGDTCPNIGEENIWTWSTYARGKTVSYLGFVNDEFKYWRKTTSGVFVEAVPFGGMCDNIEICQISSYNARYAIDCKTPAQWIDNGYPSGTNLGAPTSATFAPRLGCAVNKSPDQANNECELGSHVILCADASTAKIDFGVSWLGEDDSNITSIKTAMIDLQPYVSSQNLYSWSDNDFAEWPVAYCVDGDVHNTLGKCSDGGLMCTKDSMCEILDCVDKQCVVKGEENVVKIKKAPDFGKTTLATKESVTNRLTELFKEVYNAYRYSAAGKGAFKEWTITVPGPFAESKSISVANALPPVKISYDSKESTDFAKPQNGEGFGLEGTSAPKVAGPLKTEGGADVALLNTFGFETKQGTYLEGNIIAENGYLAGQIKFYAWADKDHMPLRQVMVNFGNGTIVGAGEANQRYKNRKPVCCGENGNAIGECSGYEGLVCSGDADCAAATGNAGAQCGEVTSFGNTNAACTTGYFSYFGMYQCKKKQIDNFKVEGKVCDGGANTADPASYVAADPAKRGKGCWDSKYQNENGDVVGACVYFPRVQVRDNWNWCNGLCPADGSAGCYGAEHCDYAKPGTGAAANYNPWTYFDGKVIVMP
jgi:hypothetical protein